VSAKDNVMKTLSKKIKFLFFSLCLRERERERERVTQMERGKKKRMVTIFSCSFSVLIRPTFTPENNKQINKLIKTIVNI
jgi:hypothetical protein